MPHEIKSLAYQQVFWKSLFEEKKMANQLASLATEHVDWITYDDMPEYGRLHVKVESGSTLGDNFQSDTFIVTVRLNEHDAEDTTKTLSAFIKVLPSNSALRQSAYESRVHQHEIEMYFNFFGLLREMHADKLIPLDVPDVYYAHIEEIESGKTDGSGMCTLLQNLKAEGYRMVDKIKGTDYKHCEMALTSLAHYHAMTMNAVRKWKDPKTGELSNIPESAKFLIEDKTIYDSKIIEILTDISEPIVKFLKDSRRPDLVKWIYDLTSRMSEIILVDTLKSSGPLGCVLHGDYWNNNMLFKYCEAGDPVSLKIFPVSSKIIPISLRMLDFQLSRIGHPLSDVLFFLYTSTMPETREKYMLILLHNYFEILTNDLKLLGIPINNITWEDFLTDYKKRSLMWMFMGVMVLSMTQNKNVVNKFKELDVKELKESKPREKVVDPPVKGESGNRLEKGETFKNLMKTHVLSDSPMLSNRILKLIEEVKSLNSS